MTIIRRETERTRFLVNSSGVHPPARAHEPRPHVARRARPRPTRPAPAGESKGAMRESATRWGSTVHVSGHGAGGGEATGWGRCDWPS
jgi:hypothetical protein